MNICSACQTQVKRLFRHSRTNLQVCYSCLPQEEQFFREGDLGPEIVGPGIEERRAHARLSISLPMAFDMAGSDDLLQLSHPARSVNMSMGGICFSWEPLNQHVAEETHCIDSTSIFFPYFKGNDQSRDLSLAISFPSGATLTLPGRIIHTTRDSSIGVEYVGTQFSPLDENQQQFLETVLSCA